MPIGAVLVVVVVGGLLVRCRPGSAYSALVLEVPDPDAEAIRLASAVRVG